MARLGCGGPPLPDFGFGDAPALAGLLFLTACAARADRTILTCAAIAAVLCLVRRVFFLAGRFFAAGRFFFFAAADFLPVFFLPLAALDLPPVLAPGCPGKARPSLMAPSTSRFFFVAASIDSTMML